MLAKEPDHRPLAAHVVATIESARLLAADAPSPPKPSPATRYRLRPIVIAALAAVGLGGAVLMIVAGRPPAGAVHLSGQQPPAANDSAPRPEPLPPITAATLPQATAASKPLPLRLRLDGRGLWLDNTGTKGVP